jgi:hypothetical protein
MPKLRNGRPSPSTRKANSDMISVVDFDPASGCFYVPWNQSPARRRSGRIS